MPEGEPNSALSPMIRPPGNGPRLNSRTPVDLFSTLQLLSADTAVTAPNRRVRARPAPRRQSRYVIRLPAIFAELCRIVHR
jgi:hypothetical protein